MQGEIENVSRPYSVTHTCQLSPIGRESPYFGKGCHSPSLYCQKWPNLPIFKDLPIFFLHEFLDFSCKEYKFSKHLLHRNFHDFQYG